MNLTWKLTLSLFPTILDVDFTAPLETKLSLIFQTWDPSNSHVHPENYGPEEWNNSSPPEWNGRFFPRYGNASLSSLIIFPLPLRYDDSNSLRSVGCFRVFFFGTLCEVTWIAWVLCGTSGCWNVQDLPIDVRKKHMEKMNLRINKNTAIFRKLRSFSEPN